MGWLGQRSSVAARRTTWKALETFIMDGLGWQNLIPLISTLTMICLGVCAYVNIYECIYECLIVPEVLWVSSICGLLCFVILENSWLFCLQVFFPLLSSFIYRQIYFHWVFLKALFVFIIHKKWSIYLLKVMSTKQINFLLVVNKKICQQINVFPLTF